jgi:hypothetical protein
MPALTCFIDFPSMKHARLSFSCTLLSFQTNLIGACHFQNCRWCFIPKQSIYHWRVPKDHRRAAKGVCCPTAGSGTSSRRRWVGNSNPAPRLVILQQGSVSVCVSLSDFKRIICLSATIREAATAMPPPKKPESEQWNIIKENERYLRSPKWDMKLHVYDDWGQQKKKKNAVVHISLFVNCAREFLEILYWFRRTSKQLWVPLSWLYLWSRWFCSNKEILNFVNELLDFFFSWCMIVIISEIRKMKNKGKAEG